MKFNHSSGLKSIMDTYVTRTARILTMPVSALHRRLRLLTEPSSVMRKVSSDVLDQVKHVKDAPKSLKEYVAIFKACALIAVTASSKTAVIINYYKMKKKRRM